MVPLDHQVVLQIHQVVPLIHQVVPLIHQVDPLDHQVLPLDHQTQALQAMHPVPLLDLQVVPHRQALQLLTPAVVQLQAQALVAGQAE